MGGQILLMVTAVLLSAIIGLIGFWLKAAHKEFKLLIKELTDYTSRLKQLIVGIQMQIEKGIEIDIEELKAEHKNLQIRTGRLENKIAALSKKNE